MRGVQVGPSPLAPHPQQHGSLVGFHGRQQNRQVPQRSHGREVSALTISSFCRFEQHVASAHPVASSGLQKRNLSCCEQVYPVILSNKGGLQCFGEDSFSSIDVDQSEPTS